MGLNPGGSQVEDAGNKLLCFSAPSGLPFRPVPACPTQLAQETWMKSKGHVRTDDAPLPMAVS
jgi:hypothetical protein